MTNEQRHRSTGAAARGVLCASVAAIALVYAAQSWAQVTGSGQGDTVETVTVTAEKRSENLQSIPAAVSAVSGVKMEQMGITDITSLQSLLPNFGVLTSQNNRNAGVQIRNFASGGANPGIEGDVGVYIDGLYYPAGGGTALLSLVDINDVEVLAGPQGTLYGRNTVAGALVVNTRAPTQTEEAQVDVTVGNFGYDRVTAYYGGGITDDLAARVVFYTDGGNNWMDDITTNTYIGGQTEYGGRARATWTPSSALTVNFIAGYDDINSTCCDWQVAADSLAQNGTPYPTNTPNFISSQATSGGAFVVPNYNDRQTLALLTPQNQTQLTNAQISADYVLPWDATLTSITGYNAYYGVETVQPISYFANDGGIQQQYLHQNAYSEELRLASKSGGWLEYLLGLYGYYQTQDYLNFAQLNPQGANADKAPNTPSFTLNEGSGQNSIQKTDSGAVFGQIKITPIDHFHIILGGRYSYTEKEFQQEGFSLDIASPNSGISGITYTGGLHYSKAVATWLTTAQYEITDTIMAYATASTGFKDGGFNQAKAAASNLETFNPEDSINYEVGAKTSWFDQKVVFNIDFFDMLVHGYQQSYFDGAVSPAVFIVSNAGDLRNRGYEATLTAKPIDPLSISGTMSLDDEKIQDYPDGPCAANQSLTATPSPINTPRNTGPAGSMFPAGTCNYNGLTPSFAPRMRWSLQAEWEQSVGFWEKLKSWNWFVESDVSWEGQRYLDTTLDPETFQDNTFLINARLGLETNSGTWRVMLWGKNLMNTLYYNAYTNVVPSADIQGATPTTHPVGYSDIYAEGRTYGAEVTYRF